ncbi:MAG TPA: hypothetical protein VMS73_08125 [Anaerolineaceae bacterium]|nr:hypothetical protein [Anaerolineaceae bacterium]
MRKKYTFLLTILPAESNCVPVQGRIEVISTGKTEIFTNLEELRSIIENTIQLKTEGLNLPILIEPKPQN